MKALHRKGSHLTGIATGILLLGCERSTRQISLGREFIETQTPIQLAQNSIPIAASPDGGRLALEEDRSTDNSSIITIVETDSQKILGSIVVQRSMEGTPIFTRDGQELCIAMDEGYSAWNYQTGQLRALNVRPSPKAFSYWNLDRTIAMDLPTRGSDNKMIPGQLVLANGAVFDIPTSSKGGFDQYGNGWFGIRGNWTMVDRNGRATQSLKKCPVLVVDQTRDRGSLHLVPTTTKMVFRDAKCLMTCIWLFHDKPYSTNPMVKPDRAAVVFAGPDILAFGFLPGRNIVYVVSEFGCYLVPFDSTYKP